MYSTNLLQSSLVIKKLPRLRVGVVRSVLYWEIKLSVKVWGYVFIWTPYVCSLKRDLLLSWFWKKGFKCNLWRAYRKSASPCLLVVWPRWRRKAVSCWHQWPPSLSIVASKDPRQNFIPNQLIERWVLAFEGFVHTTLRQLLISNWILHLPFPRRAFCCLPGAKLPFASCPGNSKNYDLDCMSSQELLQKKWKIVFYMLYFCPRRKESKWVVSHLEHHFHWDLTFTCRQHCSQNTFFWAFWGLWFRPYWLMHWLPVQAS